VGEGDAADDDDDYSMGMNKAWFGAEGEGR